MENDNVNHPAHYTRGSIETIDFIKNQVFDISSYYEGCIIKYISRYKFKNGSEDLKKAAWYLDRLIEQFEKDQEQIEVMGTLQDLL